MAKLEQEYKTVFTNWQQKQDKESMAALLRSVDPILKNAIRLYTPDLSRSPTIRSRARIIAAQAIKNYDPQRGSLKTHLMSHLQRLHRLGGHERQIMRMPEQVAMHQIQTQDAAAQLEATLGRPPSDRELSDFTGLSLRRLAHIRRGVQPIAQSQLQVGSGNAENTEAEMPATQPIGPQTYHDTWLEFVYEDMDPTNQFIMERALGMHGQTPMRAAEIAKHLKLTPGAVSQRMEKIQRQVDSLYEMKDR